MKALLTILFLFASISDFGQVTRREVKIAKRQYLNEKRPEWREIDSLFYVGMKRIRHDQHFRIIKR
jgi:hypothetical protein